MTTGLDSIDTSLQKTNEYFARIENRLGWAGRREQTYLATRTVLHRLRDHLPLHANAHLAAQLPIILKGIYFDSWEPREKPIRETKDQFISAIQNQFQYSVEDYNVVISAIIDETLNMVSEGEKIKILDILPANIVEIFC